MISETDQEQIRSLIKGRIKSVYERDIDGLLDHLSPDIISFDLMAPLQNKGTAPIKKRLESWFASYKSPINQEIADLEITVDNNVAYSHCLTRTFGTNAHDEKMDMWYRSTTGYKKVNGKWLIMHDHNSEPIDLETGKALFDLKP